MNISKFLILFFSVRKFLFRNGADVTDGDVLAIIKRLDTDRDTRISFTEFKRFFNFPNVSTKDTYTFKSSNLSNTLSKSTLYDTKSSFNRFDSPLRRTASPGRYVSPNRS